MRTLFLFLIASALCGCGVSASKAKITGKPRTDGVTRNCQFLHHKVMTQPESESERLVVLVAEDGCS